MVISDSSQGMVSAARNELRGIPVHFYYSVIDAQSLPFPSGCFNVVLANHMIYHIPDIPLAIEEMHRIISSDGFLLASTNEDDHMQEVDELVHSIEPSIIFGSCDLKGTHLIPFSMSNGSELLRESFDKVIQFKFDDELIVTEVEPLIQYILSYPGNARDVFTKDKDSELRAKIAERINQDGAFHITKSAGLFIATKY